MLKGRGKVGLAALGQDGDDEAAQRACCRCVGKDPARGVEVADAGARGHERRAQAEQLVGVWVEAELAGSDPELDEALEVCVVGEGRRDADIEPLCEDTEGLGGHGGEGDGGLDVRDRGRREAG